MPTLAPPRAKRETGRQAKVDGVARLRESRRLVPVPPLDIATYRRRVSLERRPPAWLRHYWPESYPKPFSAAHLTLIARARTAVEQGGQYAVAMGRGRGKTACLRGVALWSVVTGLCRFPVLVAKTDKQAQDLLQGVTKMVTAPAFAADYPEISAVFVSTHCDPHRMMFAADARTGKRFGAACKAGFLKMPDTFVRIDGRDDIPSPASNAVISSRGITSHDLRGTHYVLDDGTILRPDLALVDDPETAESAKSSVQTEDRHSIIRSDIRGLAGVGRQVPILAGCTILRRGCLADIITDRDRSPEWNADKFPMILEEPKNLELWEQYNQARLKGISESDRGKGANAFYRRNRRAMDAGGRVLWKHDVLPGRLSALQSAMDLRLADPVMFASEYQQDPQDAVSRLYVLTPESVMGHVNEYDRAAVPETAAYVTAGIDVNADALSWAVVAVRNDLCAWILDYGIYPGGSSLLWSPSASYTLQEAIYRGVGEVAKILAGRWSTMTRIAVDANFESETVYAAIAKTAPGIKPDMLAARGVGSKNYYVPSGRYGVQKVGESCHILQARSKGSARRRSLWFDSHQWHKRLQCGFLLPPTSAGAVSLFAGGEHRLFAGHLCADVLAAVQIRDDGREVMSWTKPEEHARNDLADAAKMALVAAAVEGVTQHEQTPKKPASGQIVRIRR